MKKIPNPEDFPSASDRPNDSLVPSSTALHHWFRLASATRIVYPAFAVLALTVIWGFTLTLIKNERADAERSAALTTHYLAGIYESQMVRALREIDQTLKIVKYANDVWGAKDVLRNLRARALLPPPLVFEISIVSDKGIILASTNQAVVGNSVADLQTYQGQRQTGVFLVGRARRELASGTWKLNFSRRLDAPEGGFASIVMVTVDSAFFVSNYDSVQMGQHGVLALVGTDGISRASRSGNIVSAGEPMDFTSMTMHPVAGNETTSVMTGEAMASTNPWDGIRRFTMAHELYGYPLAVIVGLSVDEQLAGVRRDHRIYLWRASAASLLAILIVVVLGRMSHQLALSRRRTVEEHIANVARAEYLAYHDGLTTLPNRGLFSKLLDQSIKQAHRYNRQLAVLFFDLDHFKNINDTLGHEAGDQLLQEVSARLKTCLRDSDTIARMGGDEFVALLPELDEEKYAVIVARKILAAVAEPFILHGQECRVTASIGISLYPRDGLDEQTLEKNADIAMYQVKEEGKNNFRFYSEN